MEIPRDEVQKRNDAKKNLYHLFHQKVDKDVIDMVLAQCKYDEKNARHSLLMMAGDAHEKPPDPKHNQIPVPLTDVSIVKYAFGSKPINSFDNSSPHQEKPSSLLEQMTAPELSVGSEPMNSFNNRPYRDKPSSLLEQITSPGFSVENKPVNSFNDSNPYQDKPSNLLEQIKSPALSAAEVSQVLPLSNSGYVTTFPNYNRNNSIVRTPSKTISSIFSSRNNYATAIATTNVTSSTTGKDIEIPSSGSATGGKDNSVVRRTPFSSTPPKHDVTSDLSKTDESFKQYINDPARKVLVLMRGLPGSGKSYKASKLCGRNGLVLSTDDFFYISGRLHEET